MLKLDLQSTKFESAPWVQNWHGFLSRREAEFARVVNDPSWWRESMDRAARIQSSRILILGVGGSSLGTQTIQVALGGGASSREFVYLEAPDPMLWKRLQTQLSGDEHVLIISKSGETLETLTWVERLASHFPQLLTPQRCTVVASPSSTGSLQAWAKSHDIPTLVLPDAIGGRFSVLSAVGMLPAALMGYNVEGFREGAAWALKHPEIAAGLAHAALNSWRRGESVTQLWSFAGALKSFGEWWQQLWSESLGKLQSPVEGLPLASTPMACTGPRDQHSLVQQLLEGPRDKFVYVLRVSELEADENHFSGQMFAKLPFAGRPTSLGEVLQAQASAFEKSLNEVGIPYLTIQLDTLNEQGVGALFMAWEMAVAMLGDSLKINTFNQPGVELGKRYAKQLLTR